MFERLISLIGLDNFKKIQSKKILLVGVGGVGSYALEALVRNGFTNITVIDPDKIEITNLNRQLITNITNLGEFKAKEAVLRAKSINPDIIIKSIESALNEANFNEILNNNYDYVIDACDDINTKYLLMANKDKYNYELITSMGTAKKNDPSKLSITTLDKTNYDPLAKILRKKVKDNHLKGKFYCVSSTEEIVNINTLGSNNIVPSIAGLLCVSFIYNQIINKK